MFSALFLILGALMLMMGFITDLISVNRKLLERTDLRLRSSRNGAK